MAISPEPLPMAAVPHRVAHRELIPGIPSYAGHIRYSLPKVPKQVRLEAINACPNSCPWCAGFGGSNPFVPGGKKMTRPRVSMTLDTIEVALKEIATWPIPLYELTFNNYTEIWMYKQWFEAMQLVDQYLPKVRFVLVTTGTMLTDDALQRLVTIKTLKYVNFSVNAFFQETYERIHGVSAKALQRLPGLVEKIRNMRPDIHMQASMVYDTTLVTEVERELFIAYWKPRVQYVAIQNPSYAGSSLRQPVEVVTLPCRSIFDGLTVLSNGICMPNCCFSADAEMELQIGHFPEEKLLDIWRGEKLKTLAETHNSGRRAELPLCFSCTFA